MQLDWHLIPLKFIKGNVISDEQVDLFIDYALFDISPA